MNQVEMELIKTAQAEATEAMQRLSEVLAALQPKAKKEKKVCR